jgi:hypothetical protein
MSLIHDVTISGGTVGVTNANLDVALSTRLKPADTLAKVSTVDTITNAVTLNSIPTGSNTIGKVKITDGTTDAEVDGLGYLVTVDIEHHKIHDNQRFTVSLFATGANDGDRISIYVKTPDSAKRIHALFNYNASGAAFGLILEAPTVTANTGTNNTPMFNRNRNSAAVPTSLDNATVPNVGKCGVNVTITADGTVIDTRYSGAAKSDGADSRGMHEFILLANTAYCFVVESDAAALTIQGNLEIYEV